VRPLPWLLALVALPLGALDQPSQPGPTRSLVCRVEVAPSDTGSGRLGLLAVGSRGRLAWTEARTPGVFVRDASGKVRSLGRPGGGPGEIQRFGGLGWIADTLWVGDNGASRVQFFTDTGEYRGGVRLRPRVSWAPRPGGRFVGLEHLALSPPTNPFVVAAWTPGADRSDTLVVFPRPTEIVLIGAADTPNPHPLLPATAVAVNPSHTRFCGAVPVDASTSELRCVDDEGRTRLEVRLTLPPRALTDVVYDSVVRSISRQTGRPEALIRDRVTRPRSLPQVLSLMVTDDGDMWVARSHRYEPIASWTRLRADGTVRDQVQLPTKHRLLAIRGDSAWIALPDADDLESIARCQVAASR
jgi:hypothetical protein